MVNCEEAIHFNHCDDDETVEVPLIFRDNFVSNANGEKMIDVPIPPGQSDFSSGNYFYGENCPRVRSCLWVWSGSGRPRTSATRVWSAWRPSSARLDRQSELVEYYKTFTTLLLDSAPFDYFSGQKRHNQKLTKVFFLVQWSSEQSICCMIFYAFLATHLLRYLEYECHN